MEGKIRIALPNKGALCQPALSLLAKAGFAAMDSPQESLVARCEDDRVEYLFVRAQDVAKYVESNAAFAGMTGYDMVLENDSKAKVAMRLPFGACEIALAVPEASLAASIKDLEGKRIATKLPNISRKYLSKNRVIAELVALSGATETAPSAGLADAIIDHVQTGRTLKANRLKKIATIEKSEACLIETPAASGEELELLEELLLSLQGVVRASGLKYLLLNVPTDRALKAVLQVLPAMESPTVLKLAKEGEWALQTVVNARQIARVVRLAKKAGGKDILVMPLEKVIA